MRLDLDAAPVIYLVQRVQPFLAIVQAYLRRPHLVLAATALARLECRAGAIKAADPVLLRDFDVFFGTVDELVPLTRAVMDRAAELRAQYGFATPDAIRLAAALVAGGEALLTNDQRLSRALGIRVEIVP